MNGQDYTGVFRHTGGTARRVMITEDFEHDRYSYEYDRNGTFSGDRYPINKSDWTRLVDEKWWVRDDPLMQLSEGL